MRKLFSYSSLNLHELIIISIIIPFIIFLVFSVLLTDQANQQTANETQPVVHRSKRREKKLIKIPHPHNTLPYIERENVGITKNLTNFGHFFTLLYNNGLQQDLST